MSTTAIRSGDKVYTFEDLPKRAGVRWAIGDEGGPRSSTWRLWGDKKGDVYLSVRNLGAIMKASFHRDRRCHVGLTSEHVKKTGQTIAGGRHFDRWQMPDQPIVRVAQIVVPAEELRPFASPEEKQMKWLPAPAAGHATVVSVFIGEPADQFDFQPGQHGELLGLLQCASRLTWVTWVHQLLDTRASAVVQAGRDQARAFVRASPELPPGLEPRLVLWGTDQAPTEFSCLELSGRGLR